MKMMSEFRPVPVLSLLSLKKEEDLFDSETLNKMALTRKKERFCSQLGTQKRAFFYSALVLILEQEEWKFRACLVIFLFLKIIFT